MKVHGLVILDLTRIGTPSAAKAAIWDSLCEAPAGADVRVLVPRWDWWSAFAIEDLLELGDHLGTVTVEGDTRTVRRWVLGLRHGGHHLHAVGER